MSARAHSRLAWSLCFGSVAAALATLALSLSSSKSLDSGALFVIFVPTFSVVGAVIASRQPRNAVGWIFCAVGLSFALSSFSDAYTRYALITNPGSVPGGDVTAWVGTWIWPPGILLMFTFLLLLFPDGRLPSRRWRPVAWLAGAALVIEVLPIAVAGWPIRGPILFNTGESAPAAAPDAFKFAYNVQVAGILSMFVLGVISVGSLVARFRRADRDERAQIKWFLFAGTFLVVAVILNSPLFHVGGVILAVVAFSLVPLASAVAILKYRLYDVDLVIKKTMVFGVVAVVITLVYAAIVVGVGAFVGSGSVVLSAAGAAVVAIAFQPIRQRANRLADRLVYGKRATPYEVLSEFSERVAETYSTEDVLPRMARILAEGTGASRADVMLRVGSTLRPAATWPTEGEPLPTLVLSSDELPGLDASTSVPVRHQGELLGALAVTKPPTEPLTTAEEKLVEDLAAQAGLVLRNVALIADLRASRQRLVAAQDGERRKLERNLHDGAQQQLVALSVKVRLAQAAVAEDPGRTERMLEEVQVETQAALENLRDLARGIYPPLLADQGLPAALEAQARKAPLPVGVDSDGIGRYEQEAEAAVYFCCLEALQNVAKYAGATRAEVRLRQEGGELVFEVQDDGVGFDQATVRQGAGTTNMADRLAALDGVLDLRSAPNRGTTVIGRIPTRMRQEIE